METPTAPALFEGRNLTCIRGERIVFTGLDFALHPGQAMLLLGRNGSGKSSLLRLMAGHVKAATGDLLWQGHPVRDDREAHGAATRYIGHLDAVKPILTVAENISFWVRLWDEDATGIPARVMAALDRFAMQPLAEVPGKLLSAGQKRRVNLARLFAAPAPLWLLDEPTTALDKASIKVLEDAIAEHRAAGGMVVVSTHMDIDLPDATTFQMEDFAATLLWDDEDGDDGDETAAGQDRPEAAR